MVLSGREGWSPQFVGGVSRGGDVGVGVVYGAVLQGVYDRLGHVSRGVAGHPGDAAVEGGVVLRCGPSEVSGDLVLLVGAGALFELDHQVSKGAGFGAVKRVHAPRPVSASYVDPEVDGVAQVTGSQQNGAGRGPAACGDYSVVVDCDQVEVGDS